MTLESKSFIKVMLENNGTYPGDPQMSSIWSYETLTGKTVYAIFSDEQFNDLYSSEFVLSPVELWNRAMGLTSAGKSWLEEN